MGNELLPRTFMILCKKCGNKRCPHATDEKIKCTNSNEPNQKVSRYSSFVDRAKRMDEINKN